MKEGLLEYEELVQSLEKKSKLVLSRKQIDSSSFVLLNKFGDVWLQKEEMPEVYSSEFRLYDKFFEGPPVLKDIDHLFVS